MERLEAIIFDFEGTLADVPLDQELMKTQIAALGEVFLGERPRKSSTLALEWLDILTKQVHILNTDDAQEFRSRGRLVIAAMELDAARDGQLSPMTRPILTGLTSSDVQVGIISRNISAAVKQLLPEIENLSHVFIPREQVARVKPDPAHLLYALNCLGTSPEHSLMVGNHPIDIHRAKQLGMLSAAIIKDTASAEVLRESEPDFIAPDIEKLVEHLRANGMLHFL